MRLRFISLAMLCAAPAFAGAPAKIKRAPESMLNQLVLTPKASQRLGIEIGPLEVKAVPRTIEVGGRVVPRPGTSALLRAPFSGTIETPPGAKLLPAPGTQLKAGQTVMRLRPLVAPNRNLLAETRRDVDQAEARFDTAKKALARAKHLLREGAGDQAAVELAEQDVTVAQAELRAAKERLGRAQRDPLGADVSLPLRAPRAGLVLRLIGALGQTVEQGAPLVEVVSPEDLWVEVGLYVGRIEAVNREAPARVRPLGPRTAPTEATAVAAMPAPSADGTVGTLLYRLPADAKFRPGARVTVQLSLQGSEAPKKVLPGTAVFYDHQGAAWVYVKVGDNVYERRRVEIETVVGETVVLRRGPDKGAPVVLVGAMELFGTEFGIGK